MENHEIKTLAESVARETARAMVKNAKSSEKLFSYKGKKVRVIEMGGQYIFDFPDNYDLTQGASMRGMRKWVSSQDEAFQNARAYIDASRL